MKIIVAILIAMGVGGVSWALTVGIIKLISMCFGLAFSLPVATGVWLVLILAKSIFSRSGSK